MRNLFVKIFLAFWLATTLIGAILVILALTTDHRAAEISRNVKRLTPLGRQLIQTYEESGPKALEDEIRILQQKEQARLFLFHGDDGPLSGRRVPPRVRNLVRETSETGEQQVADKRPRRGPRTGKHHTADKSPFRWPGGSGFRLAFPLEKGYILHVDIRPLTPLQHILNPRTLTLRLLITFIVTGVICYLLARSLTSPIRKLREATQNFAGGDLTTRVGPQLTGQGGEIGDLAQDFDQMAEQIETLLESQKRLLRDISHELRSPLARLNVALELARQKSKAVNNTPLDRIGKEAERLNELIGQLLTLTVLESRSELMEKEQIDLAGLLKEIVQDADYEAQSRNRSVSLDTSDSMIYGSRELLHQAIENVIRNGVWYTAENTQVKVTLGTFNDQGKFARIKVHDQGPGVPESALGNLFRPFYRVADARDRQTGGTGIGLAIAERAIRLHGGDITAAIAPEGGLVITIILPAVLNNIVRP